LDANIWVDGLFIKGRARHGWGWTAATDGYQSATRLDPK
jgi:hypothetical protein